MAVVEEDDESEPEGSVGGGVRSKDAGMAAAGDVSDETVATVGNDVDAAAVEKAKCVPEWFGGIVRVVAATPPPSSWSL